MCNLRTRNQAKNGYESFMEQPFWDALWHEYNIKAQFADWFKLTGVQT